MLTKFFLVEITSSEDTRWCENDQEFATSLCIMTTSAVKTWTDGTEPDVSVRALNGRSPIDRAALICLKKITAGK